MAEERHIIYSYLRLECTFKEVKKRTSVDSRFPTEISAIIMVFDILNEERVK